MPNVVVLTNSPTPSRAAARASKDFARSDVLRRELEAHGIKVNDTKEGQRWERIPRAGEGA